MTNLREPSGNSFIKLMLLFLMHQIIGIVGVAVGAGLLTGLAFDILRWFGFPFPASYMHSVLIGSPFFPVQIATGLILGWILGRWLGHRAMLWVWVLPLLNLCYALISLPTATAEAAQNARFAHFFGWSCRPEIRCFDQVGTTALFYVAVAYSFGAMLARALKMKRSRGASH